MHAWNSFVVPQMMDSLAFEQRISDAKSHAHSAMRDHMLCQQQQHHRQHSQLLQEHQQQLPHVIAVPGLIDVPHVIVVHAVPAAL